MGAPSPTRLRGTLPVGTRLKRALDLRRTPLQFGTVVMLALGLLLPPVADGDEHSLTFG